MPSKIERWYWGSVASPVASGNVEAGDYEANHDGNGPTSAIAFDASEATIQAALEGLASIGSGNILVAFTANGFNATYQGALADTDVPADFTDSNVTLTQKADTVSATTTQNGSAVSINTLSLNGASSGDYKLSTTSGFDSTAAIAWDAIAGTIEAALEAQYSGDWTVTDNGGGNFTIQRDTDATLTVIDDTTGTSVSTNKTQAAQPQIVTVTTPDNTTEGTLNVTLDGSTSADFNYNDSSPSGLTGWTGGGSAGNWTYTRDTNAADVSASAAEGSGPLRKACAIEIVTTQEGSAGGGGGNRRRRLLLRAA